jgi:eight-cysteine-cluster-containing protein
MGAACAVIAGIAGVGFAKRAAPPDVPELTYRGVVYAVVRESPGVVRWRDAASNETLGEKQLYEQAVDPSLERDVQEVAIAALSVDETAGCVVARDERGKLYPIEPKSLREFCGTSRFSPCTSDADCFRTGCSGEVCAKAGEELLTVCLWRDCYNAAAFRKACRCVGGRCQWAPEP